jgi:hypothetical protein
MYFLIGAPDVTLVLFTAKFASSKLDQTHMNSPVALSGHLYVTAALQSDPASTTFEVKIQV